MSTTQQLSEQEKRVKIAEECGWTEVHEAKRHHDSPHTVGLHPMKFGSGSAYEEIPDFFHDLNAMAEAEKAAFGDDDGKWHDFTDHLRKILNADTGWEYTDIRLILRSAAAQRAAAFGIALNLWT